MDRITETALAYQILSDYTSFVAISEEVRIDEYGNSLNIEIPVNMPEGMSYFGTFGNSSGGLVAATVGSTTITVGDQRGMIRMDATGSFETFVAGVIPLAVLVASMVLIVSTFARNTKEGQGMIMPVYFVVMIMGMATMQTGDVPPKWMLSAPVFNPCWYSRTYSCRMRPGTLF